jgi:hypothetical protein
MIQRAPFAAVTAAVIFITDSFSFKRGPINEDYRALFGRAF